MDSMMMDSDNSNSNPHYFNYSTHQPFQNNYQYQCPYQNQNQVQHQVATDNEDDLWEPIYTHPSFRTPNNNNSSSNGLWSCNSTVTDSDWVEEERNVSTGSGALPQPPFNFGFSGQNHLQQPGLFTNWSAGESEIQLDFFSEIEPDYRDPSRSYICPVRGQYKAHKTINRASSYSQDEPSPIYLGYKMENGRLFRKRDNKGHVKNDWDDWASVEDEENQDENILRNPKASRLEC